MKTSKKKDDKNVWPWTSRSIVLHTFPDMKIEVPKEFKFVLRKHQEIGLSWMVMREIDPPGNSTKRGGILADDMGLGKTIMMLALISIDKMNPSMLEMKKSYKNVLHEPLEDEIKTFSEIQHSLVRANYKFKKFNFNIFLLIYNK